MDITLKFLGAAGTVTGSKYLLRIGQLQVLIDCGMFQGPKELRLRNRDPFPADAANIAMVLLTHAHIDHVGYLPRLVRQGFKGTIYCTEATADLLPIMLRDAARLQEEEAEFAFRRGYSKHSKPEPLFTIDDVADVIALVHGIPMGKLNDLGSGLKLQCFNSGHILGAASLLLEVQTGSTTRKLLFSGDIGRYSDPILLAPETPAHADVLVIESTYGDRLNPMDKVEADLKRVIHDVMHRGGPVVIPAFAVGRTQLLLYYFQKMMNDGTIPRLDIYVDSPMAISVTNLYERHPTDHSIEVVRVGKELISLFDDNSIHYCRTPEESKALNSLKKPAIIISASGMCTGGRILHHMFHRLPDPSTTFLMAGYQAFGTRGRDLLEGMPSIRMFGQQVPVRCHVDVVNGLSAHADQQELLQWMGKLEKMPKRIYITHGEPTAAEKFSEVLREKFKVDALIPEYLETVSLFEGI